MSMTDLDYKFRGFFLSNGDKEIISVGKLLDSRYEVTAALDSTRDLEIWGVLDNKTEEKVLLGYYSLAGVNYGGRGFQEEFLSLDNGYAVGLSVQRVAEMRYEIAFRCFEVTSKDELDENLENDSDEHEFIAIANVNGRNRLVVLKGDGQYQFLDEASNLHKIIYVVSSETLALQAAVEELESLMNDLNAKEKDFQDFFNRHRDFIHNDEYRDAHPHIVLSNNKEGRLIPDFVLEPVQPNSLCDLLELKLPSVQIFVLKKNRMHFSAAVTEACAQLRTYSEFFDDEKNRLAFQDSYPGLQAYKPKMFVIIGRQGKISPLIRRRIESNLPNITLRTYDEVLNRTRWKVEAMKKGIIRKYL